MDAKIIDEIIQIAGKENVLTSSRTDSAMPMTGGQTVLFPDSLCFLYPLKWCRVY